MIKVDDLKKQYDQGLQIGLFMNVGMIVFLFVLDRLERIPVKSAENPKLVVFVFLLVAMMALPLVVFLKKAFLKNDWAQLEVKRSNPNRMMHVTMVFVTQAMTPILIGTIAYIVTKNFITLVPFIVLTGISFVFCFPKWARVRRFGR